MSAQSISLPSIDAGLRWKAQHAAQRAHEQVIELGARLDTGDYGAAVPLRRALQRRSRFEAVAIAFGADPESVRNPAGERNRTPADDGASS